MVASTVAIGVAALPMPASAELILVSDSAKSVNGSAPRKNPQTNRCPHTRATGRQPTAPRQQQHAEHRGPGQDAQAGDLHGRHRLQPDLHQQEARAPDQHEREVLHLPGHAWLLRHDVTSSPSRRAVSSAVRRTLRAPSGVSPASPQVGETTSPRSASLPSPDRSKPSSTSARAPCVGARAVGGQAADPDPGAGVERGRHRLPPGRGRRRQVDRQRTRTGGAQQRQRRRGGAAVHDGRAAVGGEHRLDPAHHEVRVDRTHPAEAGRGGQRPLEHGGQRRLVELEHDLGAGHQPPHVGDVALHAVGERRDQVGHRARVGDDPLAPVEPQRGRERPRAGDLHLERADVAVVGLRELVEVLAVQGRRARRVEPRPVDEAPPARLEVDVQVDEQPGGAPDDLGPGAACRCLGAVRQPHALAVDEQVAHGAHRLAGRRAGPRPDAGGAHRRAGPLRRPGPVTSLDVTTTTARPGRSPTRAPGCRPRPTRPTARAHRPPRGTAPRPTRRRSPRRAPTGHRSAP